jgi:hypothetical protein
MNFCLYSSFFQHLQKLFKKGSRCHLQQQKSLGFDVWWIYKKKLQILLFSKLKVGSDPANPIDVGGAAIAPHLPHIINISRRRFVLHLYLHTYSGVPLASWP